MSDEQFSALTELLNFCRRAERNRQLVVKDWQQLRDRMNKAFIQPGPPKSKLDTGPISDLKRGVPVSVVAEKNGLSRGTVYRIIKDHPELAKQWEDKKKKKPNPALNPMPDPAPVGPSTPPLPDVLFQFLALHKPESVNFPTGFQRFALESLLSNLGLGQPGELDSMSNEELVARVTAYQNNCENQPDKARLDPVEPPPSLPSPVQQSFGKKRLQVNVRGVDVLLARDESAKLLADEIAQYLEPFADMDLDHPLFVELEPHVKVVLTIMMLKGRTSVSDDDIPEIARSAVKRVKDKTILTQEVLEFAGLVAIAEQPIESPGDGVEGVRPDDIAITATSPQAVLDEFFARHRPEIASNTTIHPAAKRMMLLVAMVQAGLGDPDDLDLLDDEALATKIIESERQ